MDLELLNNYLMGHAWVSESSTQLVKGPTIKFNVASKRKFMTDLLQIPPPPSKRK